MGGRWELNSGLLEKQQAFQTTGPSFQPIFFCFLRQTGAHLTLSLCRLSGA